MKTIILCFMLFPLTVPAQNPPQHYAGQQHGDRIVEFFLGKEIVNRYVTLNKLKSNDSNPTASIFYYNFQHPKFSNKPFIFSFALDSAGQFIPHERTHGIIRIESSNDSAWVTADQAFNICRDQAHRLRKSTLRLAWDSTDVSYDVFRETKDFRDIAPGEIVWRIDGEILFRGVRYTGTFEVNALTGRVTRRFAIPWD